MTQFTGSNNLGGILGGLVETIEQVVGFAGRNLADGDNIDQDIADRQSRGGKPKIVKVSALSVGDSVVVKDGAWRVQKIRLDAFDEDLVTVGLSNGEDYTLLINSYLEVE